MDPSLTLAPIPSADRFQITNSRNGVNKAEEEGRGNPECGFPFKDRALSMECSFVI